ncbi:acetylglutamate kinase [Chloroflexota bacterium]
MSGKRDKVIVIKIGGATLGSHDTTIEDAVYLQQQGRPIVIVHGGGKLITEWLNKQGVASRFIEGERVTDKATLEVVIAVLAGLVNKEIVAAINGLGGRAVGVSGADGALLQGRVKNAALGYVGSIIKIDLSLLESLLGLGYIPVVAPIALSSGDELEQRILNINADTVAGEIAAAIAAERLIFLTDVAGVRDGSDQLLPRLSSGEAEDLLASGVASGGMIPKIKACLRASAHTSVTCIIDGRQPHAVRREIEAGGSGTVIGE